jgi:hypothetical protein
MRSLVLQSRAAARSSDHLASAELLETKIPVWERSSQLVEVTGAQRLQEHEPFPIVTFHRRYVAVFRLDCSQCGDSLKEFEAKRTRQSPPELH